MSRNTLLNVAVVVVAAVAGVAASMKPWQVWSEQKAMANDETKEMRESEKRRDDLVRKDAKLKTSIGREELAREKGYLKPGEVAAPK